MADCTSSRRPTRHRDEARRCTRTGCNHPQRGHERDDDLHYTGACSLCDCPGMLGADVGMNKARRNF